MKMQEFSKLVDAHDFDVNDVQDGILYFVPDSWRGLNTVAFLCPCGCGGFHMIPIYPGGSHVPDFCAWEYTREGGKITLSPSLLNGCGAHFFIRENKIIWC